MNLIDKMPYCNYCKENIKAEWTIYYGKCRASHYSFCCTSHIPNIINDISSRKEVKVVMLEKYNTKSLYNEKFNNEWSNNFKLITE